MAILQLIELRYGISQENATKIIRTEGHPDYRSRCGAAPSQELQNIELVLKSFNIELQTLRTRNLRCLTFPSELIQAHLQNQLSWSVTLELNKLKDETLRKTLLNEILARESSPLRWVQQRVKALKATSSKSTKKPSVSIGKRLKAVAKQVNKVESQLSIEFI